MSIPLNKPLDLQGVNLYLIGMMGSGKTSTAKLLAQSLGYRYFDTDTLIEQLAGCSVREIFARWGEPQFRQWETQVLAELSAYKNLVIATGGGIVLNPFNWSYLHHGLVVWLNVPLEELIQRLVGDRTRPLLADHPLERLQTLLDQRRPYYAQADLQVQVRSGESAEQVALQVLETLPTILKSNSPPQDD